MQPKRPHTSVAHRDTTGGIQEREGVRVASAEDQSIDARNAGAIGEAESAIFEAFDGRHRARVRRQVVWKRCLPMANQNLQVKRNVLNSRGAISWCCIMESAYYSQLSVALAAYYILGTITDANDWQFWTKLASFARGAIPMAMSRPEERAPTTITFFPAKGSGVSNSLLCSTCPPKLSIPGTCGTTPTSWCLWQESRVVKNFSKFRALTIDGPFFHATIVKALIISLHFLIVEKKYLKQKLF